MNSFPSISIGSIKRIRPISLIALLILMPAIFLLTRSVVGASGSILIGGQTIYSSADWNKAGSAEAFRATASASGTVASLTVYIDSTSGGTKLVIGLYTDKGGTPATLLTQGQLSNPVAGWNTVTVPAANVTGGTVYWIAVLGPAGAGKLVFRDSGSNSIRSEESSQTNLTTLPATWTTGSVWASSPVSAYASAAASTQPVLSVSPSSLIFTAVENGANPSPASLTVSNTGSGTLSFTDSADQTWLSVSPPSGTASPSQTLQVAASVAGLTPGTYNGNVTVTATGASGSPANVPVTFTVTAASPPPPTGSDWPTSEHDPIRNGNAAGESVITTSNVKQLVLQWSSHLDGKVTAQPLFLSGVSVGGRTRNVIVAATAGNSVYALDAGTGAIIWARNFGVPDGTGAIPGGFGIAAAPAVDRTSGRIYVVSQDGQLRTLSLADGTQIAALPIITSNVATNKVWGGLNLVGSNLYIATGSDGNDIPPWKGRIVRVDVSGVTPVVAGTFWVVPSIPAPDGGGGVWGYGGVAVDPATGRVYAATGATDSMPEGYTPYAGRMLALDANLNLLGSYEPTPPACQTAQCDWDFGATPIVYQPAGCPTLVAALKKDGYLYLMKADDLATSAPPIQSLALNDAYDGPGTGGLYGIPAYWPAGNMLFVTDAGPGINGINAGVVGLNVNPAPACDLNVAWSLSLPTVGDNQPPSTPTVADGVVFVGTPNGGTVHAYDAVSGTELWNSGAVITGGGTFPAPVVAYGTLYIASWDGYSVSAAGTVRAFAVGSPPPPPPAGTVLLGSQTVQPIVDYNTPGSAEAFQATATTSGTVGVLSVYVDASSTATTLVAGLYTDSAGQPGSLISQGSISQITAGAWNNIPISGAIVSAGTPYWLAILGAQSGTLRFRDGTGCTSENSAQTNLTALPASWVSGGVWPSCPLSAYGMTNP